LLTEISNQPNAEPDLKIFVEPKEGSGIAPNTRLRGYVSAGERKHTRKNWKRSAPRRQIKSTRRNPVRRAAQPFPFQLRNETPIRLPAQLESGPRAVPRFRHLPRRLVHLHSSARAGKTRLYEIKDGKPN